jgi:NADPH-dependent curcumin reductase CurA
MDELKIDGAINYKDKDYFNQLRSLAKGGVDAYFDNVGE